jgi:hypothetical protein
VKKLRKTGIEVFSPVKPMLAEDSNLEDALKKVWLLNTNTMEPEFKCIKAMAR